MLYCDIFGLEKHFCGCEARGHMNGRKQAIESVPCGPPKQLLNPIPSINSNENHIKHIHIRIDCITPVDTGANAISSVFC